MRKATDVKPKNDDPIAKYGGGGIMRSVFDC